MSKKAWIVFAAICIALLGFLVAFSSSKKIDVSDVNTDVIQTASDASGNIEDHVFGKADSKVVFVEYGDFQCPGCGGIHPTIRELSEKYEEQISFVFRNFPLSTIHPNARFAAAAAEAAGLQGKYWEMHNKLFENQPNWESAPVSDRMNLINGYAEDLKLDLNQFKTDIGSDAVTKKINYDIALGKKVNVTGTPTFYLEGKSLNSDIWGEKGKLEAAIIAELKKNDIPLPATKAE